jgi:23S rRNA (cytidine1920-2'-O)/16S rRNA (cytidine1409-2'-O)-methyltransferase
VVKKSRLDVALVERGLVATRERARGMILAGQVTVDGQVVSKAGAPVAAGARVELVAPDHPYVGRGGIKLAHALDEFGVAVEGRRALDVGASTGGFTDVLLQRGAARVYAIDVGHGILDYRLRIDPRVVVLERTNARALDVGALPFSPDVVVCDVSFISLTLILPRLVEAAGPGGKPIIALVKPQFEVGKGEVGKGGVVREPDKRAAAVDKCVAAARALGCAIVGVVESPITGPAGNVEYLMYVRTAI